MTKLLALDLGLTTGYAVVRGGSPPITGSAMLPGNATDLGELGHAAGHFIKALIEEHRPDGVVLCTPFVGAFAFKTKSGLDRMTPNINPIKLLFGLFMVAHAVAFASGKIPVYEVYEPTVRAEFGVKVDRKIKDKEKRRKALKDAVVLACTSRRWLVCDDHAADAMLAGAYRLGTMTIERAVQHGLFAPPIQRRKKAA